MPFGLMNAPAVFQHMAIDIFRDFLDIFTIVYLDDILIYSKTQEEHDRHAFQVLQRLREYGLYAKLEKCTFDKDHVDLLCDFTRWYIYAPFKLVHPYSL